MDASIPLEQVLRADTVARQISVGIPAVRSISDHRFPFTPEGAGMLVDKGFCVRMETGAAAHIHYGDDAYARHGVEICTRSETLGADIVVCLGQLDTFDARMVKRGALLLTMVRSAVKDREALAILLRRHVIALGLENLTDAGGNRPFADIIHEIDGRAAMAVASSLLADAVHGKGILLGGVAGVVPCEVTITGSDVAACAAARTALGLGAIVRMFDNNVYKLREALSVLGSGVIGSTMHRKVFDSALASADIVIVTDTEPAVTLTSDRVNMMKRGVICFDLTSEPGRAFPSMPHVDLDLAAPSDTDPSEPVRLCYVNAANTVPRTMAMALSNTFLALLDDLIVCDGVANALKLNKSLRRAAFLFLGKCVNPAVAHLLGVRCVDINLFLQFS